MARVFRNELSCARDLKNVVKSAAVKPADYVIYIVELIELTVQCGCGQCYFILIIFKFIKGVVHRTLCMVRAYSDAFTAIYAALVFNNGMTVTNADSLGGTSFYAMRTALAQIGLKSDRMMYSVHKNLQILIIDYRQRKNSS
jgi:hypothetical protein